MLLGNWESIDKFLIDRGLKIGAPTFAQTTGGNHPAQKGVSNHYFGVARDYGSRDSDMWRIARSLEFIALMPHGPITELFCSCANIFIKDGQRFQPSEELYRAHLTHCHVALKAGRRLI